MGYPECCTSGWITGKVGGQGGSFCKTAFCRIIKSTDLIRSLLVKRPREVAKLSAKSPQELSQNANIRRKRRRNAFSTASLSAKSTSRYVFDYLSIKLLIFFNFKHLLYWILQVSSIRDSKSDDKRFSIFTGTKRLHLRAETREDRFAWMEALQAVKDMFPRMSNSELMAPMNSIQVSTEKLRQLLSEEGVREEVIQESEQIMRNEFAPLQSQLLLLKQKQWLLIDTLRQLEVHLVKTRNQIRNSICSDSPTVAKWFLLKVKLVN